MINPITYWGDIREEINKSRGNEILVKILRENKIDTLRVKPSLSENTFNWQIGISSSFEISDKVRVLEKFSVKDSLKNSISQTYMVIENSMTFIRKIIFGQVSAKNLGGPVMIGQYAGESVIYGGFYSFFYLIALISISLGIVNLFPLPVLDGGQAVILTIERIIGRDLPPKLLDFFYRFGTVFLIFLFAFVFFNDIFRILSHEKKVCFFLIFLFFSPFSISQQDSWVLDDIRITGLQRVSAGSVFAVMPVSIGDIINDETYKEIATSIFETGKFDDIKLGREGNALLIRS